MITLAGQGVHEILLSRSDGHVYNILNLQPTDLPIESIAHNLSHINRYGGAQPRPMSVGLHSLLVSYLVPDSFAYEALMHDATEGTGLGDLAAPVKAFMPDYKVLEAEVRRQLVRIFGIPAQESRAVKVCDMRARELECLFLRGGNGALTSIEALVCGTIFGREYTPEDIAGEFVYRYSELRGPRG